MRATARRRCCMASTPEVRAGRDRHADRLQRRRQDHDCCKTMSGMMRPASGTIMLDGERIDRLPPHAIIARGLAQCRRGGCCFRDMTVLEHLELGALRAQGRVAARSARWIRCSSCSRSCASGASQKAGTLSRRRAADGRDRPRADGRAALPDARRAFARPRADHGRHSSPTPIGGCTSRGLTILLVEQRVDLALRLADRGYVMETGRIVLEDKADALLADERVREAYLGA